MVSEIIANNTRKPLYGYKAMVGAIFVLGFLSFIVWAHHMAMTGMGSRVAGFFQTTTIIISIPSVILVTALLLSLWGASIRFTVPMLFATAFLPMFGIGGLTGIPLAFNSVDLYLHDTYYIIGHFHYVVAPGTIFAIFAGVYYWFPKATGRMLEPVSGTRLISLVLPGLHQRDLFPQIVPRKGCTGCIAAEPDGGASYPQMMGPLVHWKQLCMSMSAFLLGLAQIPSSISAGASSPGARFRTIIHGTRRLWNGTRPLRRRMAISRRKSACTAGHTNTACPREPRKITHRAEARAPEIDRPPSARRNRAPAAAH